MKIYTSLFFLLITSLAQAQVQTLFEREADYKHFNGTVLIGKLDSIQYQASFGLATDDDPFTNQTRFDIGSITKQFTAAGILHLAKDGKIKLDDPINKHLGSFSSDKWKKVTIHQLLTHTSGIPSLYQTEQGLEIFFPEQKAISLDKLVPRFSNTKLLFSPGNEFSYSNSGYILLAKIIEQVSGIDYFTFMEKEIFEVYGLENTSFNISENVALPYYGYLPAHLKKAPIYHRSWFIGAGGVYSTTQDLAYWIQIINSSGFLTPELKKTFLSSHTSNNYGYGWQFTKEGIVQHDGGNAGFISFLSFNPKTDEYHILLTNRSFERISDFGKSSDKIRSLSDEIWNWRDGKDQNIHPKIIKNEEILSSKFSLPDNSIVQINSTGTEIEINLSEGNPTRIIPNIPLKGGNELETKLINIARHLEKSQFWKFASYANGEMKFVSYSGLMRYGFGQMKKQVGGLVELIPYKVDESHGLLRMKGNESILDLIVYFNEQGKVIGIYERGNYTLDSSISVKAYPISKNSLYVDGFPYGEIPSTFTFSNNSLFVEQFDRTIELKRVE